MSVPGLLLTSQMVLWPCAEECEGKVSFGHVLGKAVDLLLGMGMREGS